MQHIPYLTQGDTILIITPAKSIDKAYIDKAISMFTQWGLKVEVGAHALGSHYYFSGTNNERAKDLQWALNHPTAKAISCSRGGYGTIRIMDLVDFSAFEKHRLQLSGQCLLECAEGIGRRIGNRCLSPAPVNEENGTGIQLHLFARGIVTPIVEA